VAVLPYINTYQSAVLQLSYALSKLVVVTDVGGLAETVENGKSGFVVPPKDTEALKEAIEKLCRMDKRELTKLGEFAKHLAEVLNEDR